MRIGLLFGSFNPVHNGHIALAQQAIKNAQLNEVWLILQSTNQFKSQSQLLNEGTRAQLIDLAIVDKPNLKRLNIDVNSMLSGLDKLKNNYLPDEFIILMGQDLAADFTSWQDYQPIKNNYEIYTYINKTQNRLLISSGLIRKMITNNEPINDLVPPKVAEYIRTNNLYKA